MDSIIKSAKRRVKTKIKEDPEFEEFLKSHKPKIKVILLNISEKKDNKYRFKSIYYDNLYIF